MPAITSIVAKIMIIVDEVLETFVTVAPGFAAGNACGIVTVSGNLTVCGQSFVAAISDLVYFAAQLGANFLPALGIIV